VVTIPEDLLRIIVIEAGHARVQPIERKQRKAFGS
jgi:hypothetical protein